jgi:hypothetical protein
MVILAACFGLTATVSGIYASSIFYHLPPGPMIVIVATIITFLSLLLSPQGIIVDWYHNRQNLKELDTIQILSRFLLFNEAKTNPCYAHNIATLIAIGKPITDEQLLKLEQQRYIYSPQANYWGLTEHGVQFLKKHGSQNS